MCDSLWRFNEDSRGFNVDSRVEIRVCDYGARTLLNGARLCAHSHIICGFIIFVFSACLTTFTNWNALMDETERKVTSTARMITVSGSSLPLSFIQKGI